MMMGQQDPFWFEIPFPDQFDKSLRQITRVNDIARSTFLVVNHEPVALQVAADEAFYFHRAVLFSFAVCKSSFHPYYTIDITWKEDYFQ